MTDEMLGAWVINHEPENATLQRVTELTAAVRELDLEPTPPARTDVRAHALWQAQHRHTGPQRPAAGQTKRPRR